VTFSGSFENGALKGTLSVSGLGFSTDFTGTKPEGTSAMQAELDAAQTKVGDLR